MPAEPPQNATGDPARIVVVGPCASGKSTLVANLAAAGVAARVCGQEHSAIHNLWKRMEPDLLVALEVDLATLRERRSPEWPEFIYLRQRERLRDAFAEADLVIDSAALPAEAVTQRVLDLVARRSAS